MRNALKSVALAAALGIFASAVAQEVIPDQLLAKASLGRTDPGTLTLTAPNLLDANGRLAATFAATDQPGGQNRSPALSWTAGPTGTQSYVLIVQDASQAVNNSASRLWIVYNIPASVTSLPEGIPAGATVAAVPGAVQFLRAGEGTDGYVGPNPGATDMASRNIHFQVFALSTPPTLDLGTGDSTVRYPALLTQMAGNVLVHGEIIAPYVRPAAAE